MTIRNRIIAAYLTAFLTLIVGTIIFVLFYHTGDYEYAFKGLGYFVIAIVANSIVFYILFANAKGSKAELKKLQKPVLAILLNIPIGVLYIIVGFFLLTKVHVVILNETNEVVYDIRVISCKKMDTNFKSRSLINPGRNIRLWIKSEEGCEISLKYRKGEEIFNETILSAQSGIFGYNVVYQIIEKGNSVQGDNSPNDVFLTTDSAQNFSSYLYPHQ